MAALSSRNAGTKCTSAYMKDTGYRLERALMGVLRPISVLEHNRCRWTGCAAFYTTYPTTKNTVPRIKQSTTQIVAPLRTLSLLSQWSTPPNPSEPGQAASQAALTQARQTSPDNPMKTMPATPNLFFDVFFRMISSLFQMGGQLGEQRGCVAESEKAEHVWGKACGA